MNLSDDSNVHLKRLARMVAGHDKKLETIGTTPQLAYSSIEDGHVNEYNADGQLVSVIGKQFDDTHGVAVVSGPKPVSPSEPTVTGAWVRLTVTWDGLWRNPHGYIDDAWPAPMDFARVEVHASPDANFDAATSATIVATIETPRGGPVSFFVPAGIWYVRLVARTTSGNYSVPTAPVAAEATGLAVDEEFQEAVVGRMAIYLTNTTGSGYTSVIDGRGLKVMFNVTDANGVVTEQQTLVSLGTWDEDLIAVRKGNQIVGAIDSEGRVSGTVGNFSQSIVYKGEELGPMINRLPRGPLFKGELATSVDYIGQGDSPYGLVEAPFIMDGDRQIAITCGIYTYPNGTDTEVYAAIKYTINGSAPTINSNTLVDFRLGKVSGSIYDQVYIHHTFRPAILWPNGSNVRLLLVVHRGVGADLRVVGGYRTFMYLDDIGAGVPHTANHNNGGGRLYPPVTSTPAPPAVATKITNTAEWGYRDVNSYKGDNSYYAYDEGRGYQGQSPAGQGNLKSMYMFEDFAPWLSGATINWMEVFVHFDHWYNNAGGTARLYFHGYLNYTPVADVQQFVGDFPNWARGTGRWVSIHPSFFAGWVSGAYRGVALNGDGTYNTYGIASNCRIRINYTK